MTNNKIFIWIIISIVLIALIILPTFTPEDLFTTVPIFGAFGWKKFFIIAGIALVLLGIALLIAYHNKSIKDYLKNKNIITL